MLLKCSRIFGEWKDVTIWYNKMNFLIHPAERIKELFDDFVR